MADGNGHAVDGMALPRKTVDFTIGGVVYHVPAIRFVDLDVVDEPLKKIGPGIPIKDYVDCVLAIIANQLGPIVTKDALAEGLLAGEASEMLTTMNDLLRVSGFRLPEPAAVPEENLGTGTSIVSALDSPSEGSAEGTPSS